MDVPNYITALTSTWCYTNFRVWEGRKTLISWYTSVPTTMETLKYVSQGTVADCIVQEVCINQRPAVLSRTLAVLTRLPRALDLVFNMLCNLLLFESCAKIFTVSWISISVEQRLQKPLYLGMKGNNICKARGWIWTTEQPALLGIISMYLIHIVRCALCYPGWPQSFIDSS